MSGHEQIAPSSLADEGETESERKTNDVIKSTLCSQCGMRVKNITEHYVAMSNDPQHAKLPASQLLGSLKPIQPSIQHIHEWNNDGKERYSV